jgi:hypothetical protein
MITARKMASLVAALWISGFVYGLMQILWFIPDKSSAHLDGIKKWTIVYWEESTSNPCVYAPAPAFAVVDFVVCLVAPLVIMLACYLKIYCVVQSQMKRIAPSLSTKIDNSDIMTYHPEHSFTASHSQPGSSAARRAVGGQYDSLHHSQSTESAQSAYTELNNPEAPQSPGVLINVQALVHSSSADNLKHTTTSHLLPSSNPLPPVEMGHFSGHRSMSVPDVQPLKDIPLRQGALKKCSSSRLLHQVQSQGKRGSVTFKLDPTQEASLKSTFGALRIVSTDEDTNMSSEATTTDTSLSGQSSLQPKLPPSHRNSISSTVTQHPSHVRHNSTASTATNASSKSRGLFRLSDNKAVRMTSIVVGTFVLCWLPYNILFLLRQMHPGLVGPLPWDIVSSLVFISSAINPFIYNFYSAEFRRALWRIITCKDKTNIPWA